jgi:hypothetical protein
MKNNGRVVIKDGINTLGKIENLRTTFGENKIALNDCFDTKYPIVCDLIVLPAKMGGLKQNKHLNIRN